MKIYENTRVSDWAVTQVQKKMGERDRTGLLHASEIYRCFRHTVLERRDPVQWGRDAIMRFALGFALQEYFLGPEKDGEEMLGVIVSPDRMVKNQALEFKSTRSSYEKYAKDEKGKLDKTVPKIKFDPSVNEGWIKRTLGYCAAYNVNKAHILVYFIYGDILSNWTLEFTDEELEDARVDIEERRSTIQGFLDSGETPGIETRAWETECNLCPFLVHCTPELKAAGVELKEE